MKNANGEDLDVKAIRQALRGQNAFLAQAAGLLLILGVEAGRLEDVPADLIRDAHALGISLPREIAGMLV